MSVCSLHPVRKQQCGQCLTRSPQVHLIAALQSVLPGASADLCFNPHFAIMQFPGSVKLLQADDVVFAVGPDAVQQPAPSLPVAQLNSSAALSNPLHPPSQSLIRQVAIADIALREFRGGEELRQRSSVCGAARSGRAGHINLNVSTTGSPTMTGWNRRSRAASRSMCLRYSSKW